MDKEKLVFAVSFNKMKARLLLDKELIKEFELNKGSVGLLVDSFYWQHEGEKNKTKHDVIADLGKPYRGIPTKPSIQIYPIAGSHVISLDPIPATFIQGTYKDYLDNHKNSQEDD